MGRRKINTPWLGALAACCGLAACAIAFAQQAQKDQGAKLVHPVDVVVLDVSVTANRQYVPGLSQENFRVFENAQPQRIAFFHSGDAPVTVGLVIDSSQSMGPKRSEVVAASLAFVAGSNPADEMFVTHFNDVVASGFPSGERFSSNQEKVREALLAVKPEGRTSLYDAMIEAMQYLEHGRHERRALLVVSDGGDNQSRHDLDDVVELAQRSHVTIYTIGIYDPHARDRNPGALRKLANVSGGEFYQPLRLGQINDVCRQIARDIRNRYTVGYYPALGANDRNFRKIQVTVQAPERGKLTVRARPGYFPRESDQAAKKQ